MAEDSEAVEYRFRWTAGIYREMTARPLPGGPPVRGTKVEIARTVLLALVLILLFALAPPLVLGQTQHTVLLVLWGAVGGLFAMLVVIVPHLTRSRIAADLASRARQGEVSIRLDRSGLQSESALIESRIGWGAVEYVSEARNMVVIWIGAVQCIPVPDAALPEGIGRAELLRRIGQWRGAPL